MNTYTLQMAALGKTFVVYLLISVLVCFCWWPAVAQTLTFGGDGEISYNTADGTARVLVAGTEVISGAHAVVVSEGVTLKSTDYTHRTVTHTDISDTFGTGEKMVVRLAAEGMPDMQQVFYSYEGKNHFFAEVLISGSNVSSNYMAPLVADRVELGEAGDNRILFVPFDNDTFIEYNARSLESKVTNISAEVTAFYENNTRKGWVIGSVEHMHWKTGVKTTGVGSTLSALHVWGGYTDIAVTRDVISHGVITGDSVKSPRIFVGLFDDWRNGLDEYAKANAIAEPRYIFDWKGPTPFGWNSWGAIQTNLNLENATGVASFFSGTLPGFRNDETVYIDLDSYWDNMISGGLEGDYSDLVAFVRHCKESGVKPGIYWAPFVDWGKTDRKVEGSSYNYADVWTKVNGGYHDLDGARAMDPTHPATRDRIDLVIDKFKACGFEMIKIDFIGHAAIEAEEFYDPSVTTGMQAFRQGMEYLVDKLDGKMLVYAAISPNLATARYVHTRRIACDAYADINATEYTLNSTTYGWWQTYMYNYIDADHLVFGNEPAGANRARLTSGVINGTLFTGDDFSQQGQWTERAKTLLQNQEVLDIARHGVAFRPVEGNTGQSASEVFANTIKNEYYVAIINYGEGKSYDLLLDRLGIPPGEYKVKELFSGDRLSVTTQSLRADVPTRDAAIFRFTRGVINGSDPDLPVDTVTLYPNPATNILKVSNLKGIRSLTVVSLEGKVLAELTHMDRTTYDIDMTACARGIYLITMLASDGGVEVYKVMKE